MKHVAFATAMMVLFLVCVGGASAFVFVADGNLADWGVTLNPGFPSTAAGWTPTSGENIAYRTGDDDVLLGGHSGILQDERYDFEGLYAWVSTTELRLALVTSYNWQDDSGYRGFAGNYSGAPTSTAGWDDTTAGRALPRAVSISLALPAYGDLTAPTGWNYAVQMGNGAASLYSLRQLGGTGGTGTIGRPGVDAPGFDWEAAYYTDFSEANPVGFRPENALASRAATSYIKKEALGLEPSPWVDNTPMYGNTWIYEVSFDITSLGLQENMDYWAHAAPWCGNDSLFIPGGKVSSPPVPEPASLALLGLCVAGAGAGLRRRRRSVS